VYSGDAARLDGVEAYSGDDAGLFQVVRVAAEMEGVEGVDLGEAARLGVFLDGVDAAWSGDDAGLLHGVSVYSAEGVEGECVGDASRLGLRSATRVRRPRGCAMRHHKQ
jgi:hypothetical protein